MAMSVPPRHCTAPLQLLATPALFCSGDEERSQHLDMAVGAVALTIVLPASDNSSPNSFTGRTASNVL